MAGSSFGKLFTVTTWGESHGTGIGVVVDGCPAGLPLCEEDIQIFLNRRKPGQSKFTTPRKESDTVQILSGIFEGKTTGTPISMVVWNENQKSRDYSEIASYYRPGHADYPFDMKYGFRDYRGGGRSSGRETIGRVAAGAIAIKLLNQMGITFLTYSESIGPVRVNSERFDANEICNNKLYMPDAIAAEEASAYLEQCLTEKNSSGGVIYCEVNGLPVGLGEPVFDKIDANLAKAMFSIGSVKGFEIGDGFGVAQATGRSNNDPFYLQQPLKNEDAISSDRTKKIENTSNSITNILSHIKKTTNHSGGTLGGMTDGAPLTMRVAIKPTPSIASVQQTVNKSGEEIEIEIKGRHDPIIVPRAVVVVEAMASLTILDALLENMKSKADDVINFYK